MYIETSCNDLPEILNLLNTSLGPSLVYSQDPHVPQEFRDSVAAIAITYRSIGDKIEKEIVFRNMCD